MSIAEEAPTILPPSTTTSLLFSFPMQRRWRSLRLPTSIHNYYICIPISTNFHTLIRGAGNLSKHSCRSHQSSHLGQHSLLLKVEVEVLSTHRKTHEGDNDQSLHLDFNLVLHFFRRGSHWRCWPSSVFSILFIVFLAKALYLSN